MNTHRTLISLCLSVALLTGCTKVDLCGGAIHPHTGAVRFSYQWTDSTAIRPDSMIVLANRIVGTWHAVYCTTANEYANNGTCHHGHIASGKYESDSLGTGTVDMFEVKQGDYQFIAFNGNNNMEYFTYKNLPEYCLSDSVHTEDVVLGYKEYRLGHPNMKRYARNWKEFNPYSYYILSNVSPIYVADASPFTVHADEELMVRFNPRSITQDIGFKFSIFKDSVVVIDSLIAEISGIPNRINLDGSIYEVLDEYGDPYIDRTNKMLFSVDTEEVNDTTVSCYGEIAATGVIANKSPNLSMGAGIMQIGIYAHIDDEDGKTRTKCMNARINLYHTLTSMTPPLLQRNELGKVVHSTKHAVIEIDSEIRINKDFIVDKGMSGELIDHWEQIIDDIELDI